ncbi:MAG TPA: hypothetical protein VJH95_06585 [Candidatus Nanoarchaeia archaeon]|nr:hypothetical protein [Candidatus Nanoarchaeia archaeon]
MAEDEYMEQTGDLEQTRDVEELASPRRERSSGDEHTVFVGDKPFKVF